MRGIAGVLCNFEHEKYPSNSVDPWYLIIKYPNKGIGFFVCFGRATQYPFHVSKYMLWNPMYLWDTLQRGNACSLNLFGHEQYLSNSLDQNNSPHGVYNVVQ